MNLDDISTQLLYSTAPILVEKRDGSFKAGTGFFFSYDMGGGVSVPFFITNWHVIEDMSKATLEIASQVEGKPSCQETLSIVFSATNSIGYKLGSLDLFAIPIAAAFSAFEKNGKAPFYRSVSQSIIPKHEEAAALSAMEEIVFIGYPNAIYDTKNKLPLLRKGITSTPIWNNFEGSPEFLIDAGVFEGSSGSPVFILNQGSYAIPGGVNIGSRLLFVGIISQTMLKNGQEHLDLGIVINSGAFWNEIESLVRKLTLDR